MLRASFGFVSVVATALLAGCGSSGPSVNYVEGVVTLDGTPLADATVTFSPVEGGTGQAAVGTTDASGAFKLTDLQGGEHEGGVVAGEYNVGILKNTGEQAAVDPEAWKTDPNYGKGEPNRTEPTKIQSAIPATYNNPKSSGLKASVKAGKNVGVNFDLKSAASPTK